jgi:hypothetical protein
MRHRSLLALIVAAAVAASWGAEGETPPQAPIKAVPPRLPARVPSSAPPRGRLVTAEVPPDLIEKMRADLAQRAGISASAAKVVAAESIVWPNGALGCAEPGKMYTQATVPGYRVEFEYQGRNYAYHAAKNGFFQLCAHSTRTPGANVQ